MHLPRLRPKLHDTAWLNGIGEAELRAKLSGWHIRECDGIPFSDLSGVAGRNKRLKVWIASLQSRVATAMIAMQMRVDEGVEWARPQDGLNETQRLFRVCAISTIDQQGVVFADEKNVVGGKPAALKNLQSVREIRHAHQQIPREKRLDRRAKFT